MLSWRSAVSVSAETVSPSENMPQNGIAVGEGNSGDCNEAADATQDNPDWMKALIQRLELQRMEEDSTPLQAAYTSLSPCVPQSHTPLVAENNGFIKTRRFLSHAGAANPLSHRIPVC
jgi:hypothetical protein